jgi:AraC-like DNA-binding protein
MVLLNCTNVKPYICPVSFMEVKIYRPDSPLLKNYIDCFYTLTRTKKDKPCSYLSFPGLHNIVCLYTNAITDGRDHLVGIRHKDNGKLESKIVGEFNKPACISYKGPISEVTILFHPLGLNAFLHNPLRDYTSGHFSDFEPFEDYLQKMKEIITMDDLPSRIKLLEKYWESKYIGFHHSSLKKMVAEITDGKVPERSLADIAASYGMSRQQLHQQFRQHLLKSPAEFRKIVRFRHALKTKTLDEQQKDNLTQVSMLVNYFDQSHMIRDFKAITGYTPKRFFKGLSTLGNGTINWFFQE